MTEKEHVEKALSLNIRGDSLHRIDNDLKLIVRELAIIADSLKSLTESKADTLKK